MCMITHDEFSWFFTAFPHYFYEISTGQDRRIYILILGIKGYKTILISEEMSDCQTHKRIAPIDPLLPKISPNSGGIGTMKT